VQIKTILIRAQDNEAPDAVRARAEQVRQEVVARPADFKDLAQKYSVGPYARRGGDLGYVTREGKPGVDPQLVEAAFALAKGGVSGLVQTADGWNIVHVPNKRERVERTFQQMRGSVLRKLKSENYQKMYDDFVGDLKKGADVQVDAAAVLSRKIDPPQAAVGDRAFPPGAPGDLAGPEGAPEGPPLAPPAPGAAAELREDEEESQ
jgi:parvulin-like peptidyl-prolyl isomerase